jgi:hypothetical protein
MSEDIIMNAQDQVVVFCTFNEPMKELKKRLTALYALRNHLIDTKKEMASYEEDFQQGKIDVLCINSAREGINPQKFPDRWPGGSNHVIMIDRW